eukprot:scaffold189122_cov30-Tisochrysis_lutea.AAC.4
MELEDSLEYRQSVTSEAPMIPSEETEAMTKERRESELERRLAESGRFGGLKLFQRRLWRFLDEPSSSKPVKKRGIGRPGGRAGGWTEWRR